MEAALGNYRNSQGISGRKNSMTQSINTSDPMGHKSARIGAWTQPCSHILNAPSAFHHPISDVSWTFHGSKLI